ncbi:uncharacterized protein J3R85_007921 [Psidium guajava]|nr:uncharacterized protein J3R85_007921 [Psidium guajava]
MASLRGIFRTFELQRCYVVVLSENRLNSSWRASLRLNPLARLLQVILKSFAAIGPDTYCSCFCCTL